MFTAQCLRPGGLRCSPLNAALVCKRENAAISQDLAVKAHVVLAFNFSVNQRGKKPKLASFQQLICSLVL
ncbi:hypothetical protein BTR40_24840 [Vibrio parahaemolyticus]|nr:hypothetical protein BTR40_24840 [Vibrio parahaemolyticus]